MTATTTEPTRGIQIRTTGLHHVALRSSDLERSRVFYIDRLGFQPLVERPGLLIFGAGGSAVAILGPHEQTAAKDRFDPTHVGLDHVALGCTDQAELRRVAEALTAAGVQNTGVKLDAIPAKEYVAFKDPDGISWELYMV